MISNFAVSDLQTVINIVKRKNYFCKVKISINDVSRQITLTTRL